MGQRLSITLGFTAIAAAMLSASVGARADDRGPKISAPPAPSFSREIQPILTAHCLKCHGSTTQKADLDLRTPPKILIGGISGPAIIKGAASKSLLYEQVSRRIMPPGKAARLTDAQVQTIARWIDAGAPVDAAAETPTSASAQSHWAFRPPVKSALPSVAGAAMARTPVDAFVLAKLQAKGLTFSPRAEKVKLIRRATFDLTGLPPTPEEIESFLADESPDAFHHTIDRLLASPAYGERWGRHWLDNAGYADTHGGDNDLGTIKENKNIWKYRDYVVRSLNADKPFDCFVAEQLAGDEQVDWRNAASYTGEILEKLVATGFLRNVPDDTNEAELNRPLERNEIVGRVTESVASNLLGLTFQCARCHNHKYDPITQEDYFRLLACFTPVYDPNKWKLPADRCLPDVPPGTAHATEVENSALDRSLEAEQKKATAVRSQAAQRLLASRYNQLPGQIRSDVRSALGKSAEKRSAVETYLAQKLGPLVQVKPADVEAALSPQDQAILKTVAEAAAALAAKKRSHGTFPAVWEDAATPSLTRILRRGDWAAPLAIVSPGFPRAISRTDQSDLERPRETPGSSSGRRLALARWLTARDHPLTARVLVNRIWQHHFGAGIVATPDNFGLKGAPPSHPELLDWLAVDLIEHGWRLKRLHKLIMTSAVYCQSSGRAGHSAPSRAEILDPANELLARMPLRRLEAEAMRDAVLAASGGLERKLGGAPAALDSRPDGLVLVSAQDPIAASRRSLYLFARRNYPVGLLDVFDFPIMALNCTRRPTTATPLQSLAALNSEFVQDQATALADRVTFETGSAATTAARVKRAFLLAFGRPSVSGEVERCVQSIERQSAVYRAEGRSSVEASQCALAGVCHMLFCSNEFLYIE